MKEQAGWNQVEADWRRLLDLQPDGCFVAELDGIPAGTVTTCRFGPVAWVAMMLVDKSFRSRGIGRALMSRALDDLDSAGVRTIRLDATPLGRPLYESLDFVAEATFARYLGVLPPADGPPGLPRNAELPRWLKAWPRSISRSRAPTAAGCCADWSKSIPIRSGWPSRQERSRGSCWLVPVRRRGGSGRASRVSGPGRVLLADARRRYAGEAVTIDIPIDNAPATALAASWGLGVTGLLTRMGRGLRVKEDLARLWASAGPEKG